MGLSFTYDCVAKILKRLQGATFQLANFLVACGEEFDVVRLLFFSIRARVIATFAGLVLVEDFELEYCVTAS